MATTRILTVLLLALTGAAAAQTPPPRLSPQAAYEEAVRPVGIVHRSIANWSDSETASLAVAIKNGADECVARKAADYSSDALIAYARLCTLGLNWENAGIAASQYIDSTDPAKPQLALAYAIKLEAALHGNEVIAAMATAKAMLAANPYDETVDAAFNEAVEYLQLAYTRQAMVLLDAREPILLAQLALPKPPVSRVALYADGIAKASLEQYSGQPKNAVSTVAELDQALPALTTDETLMIAAIRDGYAMLGKPLPKLALDLSLADFKQPAPIDPDKSLSTVLLVYPPWCAQCIRMTLQDMPTLTKALGRNSISIHALLAMPMVEIARLLPDPAPAPTKTARRSPAKPVPPPPPPPTSPVSELLHTPTIVVAPATLALLHATDFPYLIVVDRAGIVRFAQVAPEGALRPGEFATRAAEHVAEQWPERAAPPVIQ